MRLSNLIFCTEERCKQEKPLLYAGIYFGKDILEQKNDLPTKKVRPMRLFVGTLNATHNLSGKSNPANFFEINFDSPWIELNVAEGFVSWNTCTLIDAVREDDIVEFDRATYEYEVRTQMKKWKEYPLIKRNLREEYYRRRIDLLVPYFLLLDELERQCDMLRSTRAVSSNHGVAGI